MKKFLLTLAVFSLLNTGCSKGGSLESKVEGFFKEYNVKGSFVLYNLKENKYFFYNKKRCQKGFIPASTFKILNSLISLECNIIADENAVIKWDKKKHKYASWNRDHDLTSAIAKSVVWYYQELARRVGKERMLNYLKRVNYGNNDISAGIDMFWLIGNFKVSQMEQIDLLKRLYLNKLPFSQRNMDIVKKIMINEKTDKYVLRAKTGLGFMDSPTIGWWVGWLEQNNNAYFFAINIEGNYKTNKAFTKSRKAITKKILREMGLMS